MGFKSYKLGEIYNFSSGLSKSRDEFGFGYPFVTFKDVFYNYFIPNELKELANTTEKERQNCSVERGDVFLTRTSETLHELGQSAVALKDYPNATFNGFSKRLRANNSVEIHPEYIGYYFRSPRFRAEITSMAVMTTRASLNNEIMSRLKVEIPAIEEQKAIAKILSDLDNKIEVNNKINQRLEDMEQSIFKYWFVDFEFPNEEGKPYKSSGGEMVESELGMIPKGWKLERLEEIAEIKTTAIKPQNNPSEIYEHYSIPAFDQSKYPVFEEGNSIKSNKYKVFSNSVLISKLNPDTKRMWKPLVLTENAICSTEFINYVPKEKIYAELLYSVVNSDRFTEYLVQHATGSTGSRQRANPKGSYEYKFVMMEDIEKLNLFSKIINSINLKIRINIIEINRLSNLRDTLLPKLMSGEIRVPINKEI